jgi:hypothetical protein
LTSSDLRNPYLGLPTYRFWASSVAGTPGAEIDPVVPPRFTIGRNDPVAVAGSCFAQHIGPRLKRDGFRFLEAETPVGNIYTVRQLHQLLLRAYGLLRPVDHAWRRDDGRFIDPFRPRIFPEGFADREAVERSRMQHLRAVRQMFEQCAVFVFTLGLTECWLSADGTALPVPPGVVATAADSETYRFHNFTVGEMRVDLAEFLRDFRDINATGRVILTVSPVPIVATYEDRHVLVSNTYSKSALRVIAEEGRESHGFVEYFPAYEIVTAPSVGFRYFEADLRRVSEAGLEHVMRVFARHFLTDGASGESVARPRREVPAPAVEPPIKISAAREAELLASASRLHNTICDEDLLEQTGNL